MRSFGIFLLIFSILMTIYWGFVAFVGLDASWIQHLMGDHSGGGMMGRLFNVIVITVIIVLSYIALDEFD